MGARVLKIKSCLRKLPIHPSFILLAIWFIVTSSFFNFLLFCGVVLSHEFGHYIVAKRLGYKVSSFFIAPYGACLNYKDSLFEAKDELLIAFAGPAVNFILSIITISLWWIFPAAYNFTYEFVFQSLMLGLFNLLPCYPLDGGRILVGLISEFKGRAEAIKITIRLNIVFSLILFALFIYSCFNNFNPSFCLCGVFMILGAVDNKYECKFQPLVLYKKKTKNFSKPFFLTINEDVILGSLLKHIQPNRFTVFVLTLKSGKTIFLDEEKIKLLALHYPASNTIAELLNQERKETIDV